MHCHNQKVWSRLCPFGVALHQYCGLISSGPCIHEQDVKMGFVTFACVSSSTSDDELIKKPKHSIFSSPKDRLHFGCTSKADMSITGWRKEFISIANKSLKPAGSHSGCCIIPATRINELLRDQMISDSPVLHYMDDILGAIQKLIYQELIERTGWFQVPLKAWRLLFHIQVSASF